ncbi:MAG TPA: hypothetical protein VFD25_05405 [Clostridia bacterium]|nr:hypothetical protein [Clostridia bacterium]
MQICLECKAVFEEAEIVKDPVGTYMGETAYEEWSVCPECGESTIEETVRCGCGEHIAESEPLCGNCREKINYFVSALTPDEMDYLWEVMEGLD